MTQAEQAGTPDLEAALRELEQLNSSADGLLGRFQQLSGRTDGKVIATEETGVATAELSPAGELVRLEVDRDWKTRTRPERLAAACSAAVTAAFTARTAELTEATTDVPASAPTPPEPAADPRPLAEISDETDRMMRAALAYTPPTVDRPESDAPVSVQLVGNQAIVQIDPEWAGTVTTAALNAELAAALENPTAAPDSGTSTLTQMQQQLDGLFAEALAHLRRLV